MPELEGKTVLITGSGSLGGIGADTALLFAQQGAEVLVSGRDTDRGQRVVETTVRFGEGRDGFAHPVLGCRVRRKQCTGQRGGSWPDQHRQRDGGHEVVGPRRDRGYGGFYPAGPLGVA